MPPAIVGPHAAIAIIARGRRSGRSGRSPARASAVIAATARGSAIRPPPSSPSTRSSTPVVRMASHSGSTKWASTSRSWTSPAWLRTWSLSRPSGSKPSLENISTVGSWAATTSTTSFVVPISTASTTARWASRRPSPRRRCSGSTTRRISPTWRLQPTPRMHGDVAADVAVDEADEAVLVGVGEPALDDAGLQHVLAEERAVALRHAGEEAAQRVDVVALERPDLDLGARAGHQIGSEWRPIQSAIAGMLRRWAALPTITPTCPDGRRSSSTSVDPTSEDSGPTPSGRDDVVLLADDVEERHRDVGEVDVAPAERDRARSAAGSGGSSGRPSGRKAAPGNGMWSRPHCVITWWAATNSSFQRCCHRLT